MATASGTFKRSRIPAVLLVSISLCTAGVQAGEDPQVPARLAVRPSTPGNLTPLSELVAGIDNLLLSVAASNQAKVAPLCDDATFLRRVTLDLTAEIPSLDEIKNYAKSNDARKRETLVAELLKRPEYAERWAQFWTDALLGTQSQDVRSDSLMQPLRAHIWRHLRAEKPFDELARELLTASAPPAGAYLATHLSFTDLPKTTDSVARNFLGARIGCAQCHDHPFDKWTQQDFWGFASFLSYTSGQYSSVADMDARLSGEKYDPPSADYVLTARYLDGTQVDVAQPLPPPPVPADAGAGMPMKPMARAGAPRGRPLEGTTTGEKLRRALATLITERNDLRFDRAIVNRVWGALFGRGLIHPIDDIRSRQNGAHDDILDLIAADFHASGRDMKRLLTLLTRTQAYQRDSADVSVKARAERDRSVRYFARAEIRPMTPEMLAGALTRISRGATGYDSFQRYRAQERQSGREANNRTQQDFEMLRARFRPRQQGFGDSGIPADQENSFQRAMMMMNAEFMQRLVQDGASSLRYNAPDDGASIFLVTLCRMPSPEELHAIDAQKLKRDALLWVLFNSAEFSSIR